MLFDVGLSFESLGLQVPALLLCPMKTLTKAMCLEWLWLKTMKGGKIHHLSGSGRSVAFFPGQKPNRSHLTIEDGVSTSSASCLTAKDGFRLFGSVVVSTSSTSCLTAKDGFRLYGPDVCASWLH